MSRRRITQRKTLAQDEAWGRDGLMVVAAFRYCCGRQTYITSDCSEWLVSVWAKLPENVKHIIKRELEEEFKRDDEDRALNREHKALGWDCDRASWEKVRALWAQEGQNAEAG